MCFRPNFTGWYFYSLWNLIDRSSFYANLIRSCIKYMCSFSSAIFLRVSIAETLFSNKLGRTNETLFGQEPNMIGGKKVTSIVTYQLFISTDFRSTFKINGTKENYVIQIICVKIKHLQISQQYSNKKKHKFVNTLYNIDWEIFNER